MRGERLQVMVLSGLGIAIVAIPVIWGIHALISMSVGKPDCPPSHGAHVPVTSCAPSVVTATAGS